MTVREALEKMTLPRLRAIVKKYDADVIISKYSKMKKPRMKKEEMKKKE